MKGREEARDRGWEIAAFRIHEDGGQREGGLNCKGTEDGERKYFATPALSALSLSLSRSRYNLYTQGSYKICENPFLSVSSSLSLYTRLDGD